jgi:hypothetical protein
MAEAAARLARLRKQRKFLRSRDHTMLVRGLKSLDELDTAKEKEHVEAETQAAERQQIATTSVVLSDFSIPDDLNDPFWERLDFGGGIAGSSQGS